jgi:hypothetical protein
MNASGDVDPTIAARAGLLDALDALHEHLHSVIVIGAQAIYLRTGAANVALAEATKDSDLALDTRTLRGAPRLEEAMRAAGFRLDPASGQPGAWLSPRGIPVDLMIAESQAGDGGRRGARIPPHSRRAARRATGLEAALVDYSRVEIQALDTTDGRRRTANVAGPAALLVAKMFKLSERRTTPGRLLDKDAHDVYRLLVAVPANILAGRFGRLSADELAGPVTERSLGFMAELFAKPTALGSVMAGRAEEGIGQPATVSASVAFLAADLLTEIRRRDVASAG